MNRRVSVLVAYAILAAGCAKQQRLVLNPFEPVASVELKVSYHWIPKADGRTVAADLTAGPSQRLLIERTPTRATGGTAKLDPDVWLKPVSVPAGRSFDLGAQVRLEWSDLWTRTEGCDVVLQNFAPKPGAVYLYDVTVRRRIADGCTATLYEKSPAKPIRIGRRVKRPDFQLIPIATSS
jgi:hypothetical protein